MSVSRGAPSLLLLLGCVVFLAGRGFGASSHSLRYVYTGVSEPGEKEPQFFSVGYVDDQQFVSYDATAKRRVPTAPWIRKVEKEDPQYWERGTAWKKELDFRVALATAARYYNQSGGTHTLQWMYGCELRRDGSKGGHAQYAYDGRDYISLDKETLTWIAADIPAQNTKRKWEAEPAFAMGTKVYLEEDCIDWLQRYLEYGKETLLRTEKPEVTVTRKEDYDGMETLICRVGGFYPKNIDITWTRDGEVWMQDTYHGLVSPNSDGTYYTWRSITVDPKEKERYKCHVEHDGLLKPVDLAWEEPASLSASILWVIIGCVVVALVGLLAAGIAVYFKKRQNGYKAALDSDKESNSSGTESAVIIAIPQQV